MSSTTDDELIFSDLVDMVRHNHEVNTGRKIGYAEAAARVDKAIEPQLLADRKKHELDVRVDEIRYVDEFIIGSPRKVTVNNMLKDRIAELKEQRDKL